VGVRPTFGDNALAIEAYLIDVAGDFYGRALRLHFIVRIRGERKFAGVAELSEQIARDVASARRELSESG
jgi:riboflavin kinase/FMN adenylyltransferase